MTLLSVDVSPQACHFHARVVHKFSSTLALTAILLSSTSQICSATTLIDHVGANDPSTEGWLFGIQTSGYTTQPIFDDQGFDAWQLSTTASADVKYTRNLDANETAQAVAQGWSLSVTTRVLQADPGGMVVRYSSGTTIYSIDFSVAVTNELFVSVGDVEVGMGADSTTYNSYVLTDDSGNGHVDFFINGIQVLDEFAMNPFVNPPNVTFGDVVGSTIANSTANYSSVTFSILPEPSTALLLLAGGLACTWVHPKQRRFFRRTKQ